MRKLLIIGSILIVGLTTFAGVSTELIKTGQTGQEKYNGVAKMNVGSRGIATDGTGSGTLIVTPTINGSVDGTALQFNFKDLVAGMTQKTTARFKAEVINDQGQFADLNNKVTLALQTVQIADGSQTINPLVKAIDLKANIDNTPDTVYGKLAYEITDQKVNNSGKTFEGEIVSTVSINKDTKFTGNFEDNSARVKVAVNFGTTAPTFK